MRPRAVAILVALLALSLAQSCKPRETEDGAPAPGASMVDFALGLQEVDPTTKLLGNLRAVVVLMDFADAAVDKEQYPPERLRAFMFDREAKGLGHFLAENSGGRYTIDGEVFGWYRSRHTVNEVNATAGGLHYALGRLAEEAVRRVLDDGIDTAAFDSDDDGLVDELYIIVPNSIEIGLGIMGRYADFAERTTFLHLTSEDGGFAPFGFYLREGGHVISFALDHYGNHWQGEYGIGIWGMMGLGCWGQRGDIPAKQVWTRPSHFTAFYKIVMGWVEPRVITETTRNVKLTAMEVRPDCIEIPIPGTLEYFLVENRQPIGVEDELPGGGLLIWHCTRTWRGDFQLVQADGRDDLQHGHAVGHPYPPTTENLGDAGDPFPGSTGNRTFGAKTTPNSHTAIGLDSGITVRGISPPGETMSFDIIIDAQIHDGLARLTTIRGCLDELKASHVVRRRNAALALIGIADDRAIPALIDALENPDRKVRLYTTQALGHLKSAAALPGLAHLAAHGDPELAAAAIRALGRIAPDLQGGPRLEALARMTAALDSGAKPVRAAGLEVLGWLGDPAFEQVFIDALDESEPALQRLGAEGLGSMKSRDAVARLIVIARDEARPDDARIAAVNALGRIGYEPVAIALHSLLHAPAFPIRQATVHVLGQIHSKDSIPALVGALGDEAINKGNMRFADLRKDVRAALVKIGLAAVPALVEFLDEEQAPLEAKLVAAAMLADLRDPSAVDPIVRLALSLGAQPTDDPDERDLRTEVRNGLAAEAQRLITDKPVAGTENEQRAARPALDLLASVGTTWLKSDNPSRRIDGAELLTQCAQAPAPNELLDALDDGHADVREAAATAFATLEDARAVPGLIELLNDDYKTVRRAAAAALARLGDARAVPALVERMTHETDDDVSAMITCALANISAPEVVLLLCDALKSPVYEARTVAARGLAQHKTPEVVDALIAALPDADYGVLVNERWARPHKPRLRVQAMGSLAAIGDPRAIEPITAYLEADDLSSRLPAALALMRLSGKQISGTPWPDVVAMLSEHIEAITGRELLEFVPREYLCEPPFSF